MKKTLLSIAALLLGLLAHSQEADDLGNYAEVTIIPRLDVNPSYGSGLEFDHGNSSIYTLFEGSASEHFSWTVANHWLSAGGDYGWPYTSLGYSNTTNWLDFCAAYLTFGNWEFTLGKDLITTGAFEFDDWDWDVYDTMASILWHELPCYQWGGKVAYTVADNTTFSLQMTTSPYGERPFSSGLWTYSGQWSGEYGWLSTMASATAMQYDGGTDWIYALGLRGEWDSMTATLNYNHASNCNTFMADYLYSIDDKWNVGLKSSYMFGESEYGSKDFKIGALCEFYPLEALRIHALASYDTLIDTFTLSLGARFNINFKVW